MNPFSVPRFKNVVTGKNLLNSFSGKGYIMADKKQNKKGTEKAKGYSNKAELEKAVNTYLSTPKERRGIMKRINNTSSQVLNSVFNAIVNCNWDEVVKADPKRIQERNKKHTGTKHSYIMKG